MRHRVLSLILLATLVAGTSCHKTMREPRSPSGPEQHFSLWLEHSPSGWSAHCDSGCSWRDVTLQCTGCRVHVDADGIGAEVAGMPSRGFAFVLDDSNGLRAHGVQGVRWLDLSWGCASAVCRARISEEGVHVPT